MTRKTFQVMFFAGLFVLGSLFAGCGLGQKTDKATAQQLQIENLQGQLERAERDRDRAEDESRGLEDDLRDAKMESDDLRQQLASKPAAGAMPPGTSKIITVSGSVLFRAGSADLTSAGKGELDTIASSIRSQYSGRHISVEGHTDSSPLVKTKEKWQRNVWLSANRAWAVADYLISRGVSENLVSVVGHGASRPTGRGPDQDRRVEIIVLSQ